ncbi:type II toxin-antitoxin system PemI/MazE family antitoxin [Streptococcus cuniculipharyngis]|uniref:AbrB family transcriptional regulator n=1 Tax=Streptococcus cuniculipharyngis TaxID=1562651 RepID=A0A5C5SDW7_9STRE|nr:AbrB family transcriptional regulator [Streptococcus cuniculipharyngis]TWS99156.1 AbrB family transcriptional regulator [Streptococcus cuniculipharyngis]
MNLVKTRKVGNSITVTLPKDLGITTGQEFLIEKGRNDVIILVPKIPNPFNGSDDLTMTDDFGGVALLDHE